MINIHKNTIKLLINGYTIYLLLQSDDEILSTVDALFKKEYLGSVCTNKISITVLNPKGKDITNDFTKKEIITVSELIDILSIINKIGYVKRSSYIYSINKNK
jgi:hypothetical protein